jgi:hypothetical protein
LHRKFCLQIQMQMYLKCAEWDGFIYKESVHWHIHVLQNRSGWEHFLYIFVGDFIRVIWNSRMH